MIRRTLDQPPPGDVTHWTVRAMAEVSGISPAKVHEIWREASLAPHRVRRFKLSHDPVFAQKLEDVVGLYVDPPRHAIVLSLDEKSHVRRRKVEGSGWWLACGHVSDLFNAVVT